MLAIFFNRTHMGNLFSFQGRIGRLHFLLQCIVLQSLMLVLILGTLFLAGFTSLFETFLSHWLIDNAETTWPALLLFATLPVTFKRLRDLGLPLYLVASIFIPKINILMYLAYCILPGKNRSL